MSWVQILVIVTMGFALLINWRIAWLNKNDVCSPTAEQCTKASLGHLDRHHSSKPVPFHDTCPRRV